MDCKAELVDAIHDILAFGDTKVNSRVGLAEIRDVLRHDQNVILCRDYVADLGIFQARSLQELRFGSITFPEVTLVAERLQIIGNSQTA